MVIIQKWTWDALHTVWETVLNLQCITKSRIRSVYVYLRIFVGGVNNVQPTILMLFGGFVRMV